ncbi:hypothetical protein HZH66_006431 [Vespula vulgaris]|uniref:Uncharacterized protein n=1 Tax=Vespula vulgaris TaxID=7454 RepID=A0A834K523_VESVU|nr:hypothetical protein HZH66_006431 [Vespula vulgaris]
MIQSSSTSITVERVTEPFSATLGVPHDAEDRTMTPNCRKNLGTEYGNQLYSHRSRSRYYPRTFNVIENHKNYIPWTLWTRWYFEYTLEPFYQMLHKFMGIVSLLSRRPEKTKKMKKTKTKTKTKKKKEKRCEGRGGGGEGGGGGGGGGEGLRREDL